MLTAELLDLPDEEEDLPCLREYDTDGWQCLNDHTGCLWNNGNNECMHPGTHCAPLIQEIELDVPFSFTDDTEDLTGCQSTTHDHATCYGFLWECSRCHHMVCCADGQDDSTPDLCDACWLELSVLEPDKLSAVRQEPGYYESTVPFLF